MALPTTYSTGSATVNSGEAAVAGQGTTWLTSGLQAGDVFWAGGMSVRIASVNSNTSLTLAYAWPGATRTAADYEVNFTPDASRTMGAARAILDALSNSVLNAFSGLVGAADKIPYFTGAGTAALATFTTYGRSLVASANAAAARTALELKAVASTGSASDLEVGTVPDGRLPDRLTSSYMDTRYGRGPTIDGDFFPDDTQFAVDTMFNVLNRWKLVGANNGLPPQLRVIGFDENIPGAFIAKGLEGFIFGNGAGTLFAVADAASGERTSNWITLVPAKAGADPVVKSQRGMICAVAGATPLSVTADGLPIFEVVKLSGSAPRKLLAEVTNSSATIRPESGDLTLKGAASTDRLQLISPRISGRKTEVSYSAQNPASGSTIAMAEGTPRLIIANGGVSLAALTITLPPNPVDGDIVSISFEGNVTTLTINASQTVRGAPTTATAQTPLVFQYTGGSFNRWVRY